MAMKQQHRVFFALWPDDAVRRQIRQLALPILDPLLANGHARKVAPDNWHITLAFIGSVTTDNIDCLIEQANQLALPSFHLRLNQMQYWPRPHVVWLGCETVPDELTAFQNQLTRQLVTCGHQPESYPYIPHITLLRNVRETPPALPRVAIPWSVKQFALVESHVTSQGSRYEMLQQWQAAHTEPHSL